MLKGNIPLDRDFSQPQCTKKPKKAKDELVADFGEASNPQPAIKNSPFDEMFYPLFDRIQASNDLPLLNAIAKVVDDYGF